MAAQVHAVLRLASEGAPNGALIFAATADERGSGTCGVKVANRKLSGKNTADFAINEGEEPIFINGQMIYFIQLGKREPHGVLCEPGKYVMDLFPPWGKRRAENDLCA